MTVALALTIAHRARPGGGRAGGWPPSRHVVAVSSGRRIAAAAPATSTTQEAAGPQRSCRRSIPRRPTAIGRRTVHHQSGRRPAPAGRPDDRVVRYPAAPLLGPCWREEALLQDRECGLVGRANKKAGAAAKSSAPRSARRPAAAGRTVAGTGTKVGREGRRGHWMCEFRRSEPFRCERSPGRAVGQDARVRAVGVASGRGRWHHSSNDIIVQSWRSRSRPRAFSVRRRST